jgi:hypothetical protein
MARANVQGDLIEITQDCKRKTAGSSAGTCCFHLAGAAAKISRSLGFSGTDPKRPHRTVEPSGATR